MIAIANYNEKGKLLKYCYECKGIKPTVAYITGIEDILLPYRAKRICLSCGRLIDYYKHLMSMPKIRDDY